MKWLFFHVDFTLCYCIKWLYSWNCLLHAAIMAVGLVLAMKTGCRVVKGRVAEIALAAAISHHSKTLVICRQHSKRTSTTMIAICHFTQ